MLLSSCKKKSNFKKCNQTPISHHLSVASDEIDRVDLFLLRREYCLAEDGPAVNATAIVNRGGLILFAGGGGTKGRRLSRDLGDSDKRKMLSTLNQIQDLEDTKGTLQSLPLFALAFEVKFHPHAFPENSKHQTKQNESLSHPSSSVSRVGVVGLLERVRGWGPVEGERPPG